jgi:hypothetical protein
MNYIYMKTAEACCEVLFTWIDDSVMGSSVGVAGVSGG